MPLLLLPTTLSDDEDASCVDENSAKSSKSWLSTLLEEKTVDFLNRISVGHTVASVERGGVDKKAAGGGGGGEINAIDAVVANKKTRMHVVRVVNIMSVAVGVEQVKGVSSLPRIYYAFSGGEHFFGNHFHFMRRIRCNNESSPSKDKTVQFISVR